MGGDICKLCKKEAVLRYSHILPEFFYLPLYDKQHRTVSVQSDQKEKLVQKGIREYLLCQECETRFSRYENYAATLIKKIPTFLKDKSGLFVGSNGVDYEKFKLFQLSMLWRASVSQTKMFANVKLGNNHEERIRRILNDENPGKSSVMDV